MALKNQPQQEDTKQTTALNVPDSVTTACFHPNEEMKQGNILLFSLTEIAPHQAEDDQPHGTQRPSSRLRYGWHPFNVQILADDQCAARGDGSRPLKGPSGV